MKSPMQHSVLLARAAWLPLLLASAACSMDLSLGDLSRRDHGSSGDDSSGSAAAPVAIDGALPTALRPPDVTIANDDAVLSAAGITGVDLDADGFCEAFELGPTGFDRMGGRPAPHVGHNEANARRGRSRVDKRLRAARAVLVVFEICHGPYLVVHVLGIKQLDGRARHYGRDGVLINQLRQRIAPEQQAEIVKPRDDAL